MTVINPLASNSKQKTLQVEVILNNQTEWPYFIQNIRAQATDHGIWHLIDPNLDTQPALTPLPIRPTPQTAGGTPDQTIATLSNAQQSTFKLLQDEYRVDHGEWRREQESLISIHQYIREHITLPNHNAIANATTVWETLYKLQTRCQPSPVSRRLELKMQWNRLMNSDTKNQDWRIIIDKVANLHEEIVKEKVIDDKYDDLTLQEALNLIGTMDIVYAKTKKSTLNEPGCYINSVERLVESFRNYLHGESITRQQSGRGSFAFQADDGNESTFKGQGRNNSTDKQHCPCGFRASYHRPATCYYVTKKTPREGWTSRPHVQARVDKALQDPRVRSFVDKDRNEYIKQQAAKQVDSTTTQTPPTDISATYQTTFYDGKSQKERYAGNQLLSTNNENPSSAYQTTKLEHMVSAFNVSDEPEPYYFTNSWLLDGGTERHVCNSPLRNYYTKTREANIGSYVQCGLTRYRIESYGDCTLTVNLPGGGTTRITITDVALCPYFRTNLLSTHKLENKGLHLITLNGGYMCPEDDVTKKLYIPTKHKSYWCLEFNAPTHHQYARDPRESIDSYKVEVVETKGERSLKKLLTTTASQDRWHRRLGHPGPETLKHLAGAVKGDITVTHTPSTIECEICSVSKAHQIISRSTFKEHPSSKPFQRINYDLIPMPKAYNDHRYISHFACDWCDFIFIFTHTSKKDCVRCFMYVVNICYSLGYTVQYFHTDGETTFGKETSQLNEFWDFVRSKGIIVEQSTPRTQSQNGAAEVKGKHIIIRQRTLRIQTGHPEDLWPEHALATAVISNKIPIAKNGWISPYEVVYKTKPVIFNLITYGAKAYALNKNIAKLDRLSPRAFIGHLVGYEGTNIYRIWIPSQRKVIRTRDVVFDEDDYTYNPSEIDTSILYPETVENQLIITPMPSIRHDTDVADIDISDSSLDEPITNDVTNIEALLEQSEEEDGFATPQTHGTATTDQNDYDEDYASSRGGTVIGGDSNSPTPPTTITTSPHPSEPSSSHLQTQSSQEKKGKKGTWQYRPEGYKPKDEISSKDFPVYEGRTRGDRKRDGHSGGATGQSFYTTYEEDSSWNGAFSAFITSTRQHQDDLAPQPKTYDEAKKHPDWLRWKEAMQKEINDCNTKGVYKIVSHTDGITMRPIPLKWVYTYKLNSDGYLIRHKARLCVRGDKQPLNELDTYAATLAAEVMRFLLAMAAHFDLEMRQFDAVTAFLNANLDETVYTTPPPGFSQKGQIWHLLKALYGLRRSPHLWHNELSGFLQSID